MSFYVLDELDRKIIKETQSGLPITEMPFHTLAEKISLPVDLVQKKLQNLIDKKVIRRIAVVPHHYNIGITYNAMTVWNLPDEKISELGQRVGRLEFVSHCYRRPRVPGLWNFNLFAMVHGRTKEECFLKAQQIEKLLGENLKEKDILFSRRVLKKTGFRL